MDLILDYLGVESEPPDLAALDKLLNAYVRHVPWESASRIGRRAQIQQTNDCPRWPDLFWNSAIQNGTGGTCFESNYAFFHLLQSLGYEGYLTINNMNDTCGCHTAIVVTLENQRYLVDVGLPIHLPIPLDPTQQTSRKTDFHTYTATPQEPGVFVIERDNHPNPYCFTLIDTPIDDASYRRAVTNDYEPDKGLFLDRVIVVRVINGRIHRFSAEGAPYQIEAFHHGDKTYYYLGDDPTDAAIKVADKFGINQDILKKALEIRP